MSRQKKIKKAIDSGLLPDDALLIYKDDLYRLTVENDQRNLDKSKKDFEKKMLELKNLGILGFI